ncbi:MAG: hypothetical protein ACRDQW_15665 [Haloechinothrix sp.]
MSIQGSETRKPAAGGIRLLLIVGSALALLSGCGGFGDDKSFTDANSTLYFASGVYDGQPIPMFTPQDKQQLSTRLADLEQQYGLCFGWTLQDGATKEVQAASSRGPDVRADTCPSWVEVRVGVAYVSESSSSFDAADVEVAASPDLPGASSINRDDFVKLGIDAAALIDDPVSATGHAALALPLLLIEAGALEPGDVQEQADEPTQPAQPLPASGDSEFPGGTIFLLVLLGVGAVVAIVLGFASMRRGRDESSAGASPTDRWPPPPREWPPPPGQQGPWQGNPPRT